ncbi:membrane protein [Tianweitania populi]|uniref:Membrane protein n=2 Tax=Tianweitania populi TaxID=1607949 RepID=A0A8J3GKB7_9HYPH|nr:membrane protein [Tianweitania populi]
MCLLDWQVLGDDMALQARGRVGAWLGAVLLGLAMVGGASAQSARTIETTPDVDYFGFDLRTEKGLSLDQCEATCLDDKTCRAFTYNSKAQWCFLKSDFDKTIEAPGAIAGKVVDQAAEPDLGAPAALTFLPADIVDAARKYRNTVTATQDDSGGGLNDLLNQARQTVEADPTGATALYTKALALSPDDAAVWTELARASLAASPSGYSDQQIFNANATSAALNGYLASRSATQRADALAALAAALDRKDLYRPALSAYEASLDLVNDAEVQAAFADLKVRKGFRILDNSVDADSATPRICAQFSEELVKSGTDYATFVTLDGKAPPAIEAKDKQICIDGLEHGHEYRVTFRSGLPAAIGESLQAPVTLNLYVRDRTPSARFTGDAFVLPSAGRHGLPLVSVNMDTAKLQLFRIGDRALSQLLSGEQFLRQLDGYSLSTVESDLGTPAWEGTIDVANELNKEVVTSFPVDEALPERKPGVYVMVATPSDDRSETYSNKATQWFVVSDIGLSTYTGQDGLTVFARSLNSAEPLEDVELALLARNNEVLGTATSDDEGKATFTPGLVRGTAGLVPTALMARSGDDFVFLDMTRAGFDLSDRGVTGRAAPGALDIFAWTERGIYRAGETVHAAALVRNDEAKGVGALPLTFIFTRPDGVEDRRIVVSEASLGGYAVDFPTQSNAMRGSWQLRIYADPKQPSLAAQSFLVEDFVPDRMEFDLAAASPEIAVGEADTMSVDGRFLYGAPAAGLSIEGEVNVRTTRNWARFPGFQFGLADEDSEEQGQVLPLENLPVLDDEGKASFDVSVDAPPSTTRLLNAEVVVRMREGGGRAVERRTEVAIQPETNMIGIRLEGGNDSVPEGSTARFSVLAADAQGNRIDAPGLFWRLIKIDRDYQWYRSNGSWNYEPVTRTSKIAEGKIDAKANAEAQIATPVAWGRYRLEIETNDPAGPATSREFEAGWYVEASSTETPDALEVAFDKPSYAVGDTAKLQVTPRFGGEALITIGSERLVSTITASVPEGGTTIDVPVTEDFGAGAYVTTTLFRPGEAAESRLPMRAIGIKWLAVDPAERKLDIALETPEKSAPRSPLVIPVSVPSAADKEAYITVAAVDVGILNLTSYKAPDPEGWYYGQRQLGLEIRDLYGRLIDGSLGATGRIRTGGDGGDVTSRGNPPKEKLVAFFSGPVKLDDEGKAEVSFDLPQFNGTVRVMAVAWTEDAFGHAEKDVIVRDPVVITSGLPRFLTPGDAAELRLDLANTDGPAGGWTLDVTTNDQIVADAGSDPIELAAGGKATVKVPLTGMQTGDGRIMVSLRHPDGTQIDQELFLPLRPSNAPVTTRNVVSLAPGASLTVDRELLASSILDGATVSIGVTPNAAFDVASLVMTLDRYPYGCAEQTTSRAMPLLYLSELAKAAGIPDDPAIKGRIQDAIARVLSYQSSSGSFGLWGPGYGDLWLDAYVTDFLTRAREQGYEVPAQAMMLAVQSLGNSVAYDVDLQSKDSEIAYTFYVLARNKKASIGDLRYYADTRIEEFKTPMARAQLGAALALYGDNNRAEAAFGSAFRLASGTAENQLYRSDYGSDLRDGAAMLALAAETKPSPAFMPQMISLVAKERNTRSSTSTQEEAWMTLAARAVVASTGGMKLDINGTAQDGGYSQRLDGTVLQDQPVTITNKGKAPVDAVVTAVAPPVQPLPAGGNGFAIERSYYSLDGEPVNPSEVEQNQRFVVVLKMREDNAWPSRVLVTDLLPAGFEIDNPSIVNSAGLSNFDWLEETETAHLEFRDDRFVAAFNRTEDSEREVSVAYVVRAVTPGVYAHPAASVEDMYRPEFSARTASGMMEVKAP